jgi:phosphoglucosamine mutase
MDGVIAAGAMTIDLDVAPTPVVQKVAGLLDGNAEIISASHGQQWQNGVKYCFGATKPTKAQITDVSERYWTHVNDGLVIPRDWREPDLNDKFAVSAKESSKDFHEWYREKLLENVRQEFGGLPLEGTRFVIDTARGAANNFTPEVFEMLGATVDRFACDTNGAINDGCGATDSRGVKRFLKENPDILHDKRFVGALLNDGDADRVVGVGAVWKDGQPQLVDLDGNIFLAKMAEGEPGVVGTEYINSGTKAYITRMGVGFEQCLNGDANVTRALLQRQNNRHSWRRGGEASGHQIDTGWLTSGDGIRTAAWFASLAVQQGQTFGDIHQSIPLWPERHDAIRLANGDGELILGHAAVKQAIARVEGHGGVRHITRPSGTEPALRLFTESQSQHDADYAMTLLQGAVEIAQEDIRRKRA